MASVQKSCVMCESYQRQIIEKDITIKLLSIRLKKIKQFVLNIDNDQCDPCLNQNNCNEKSLQCTPVKSSETQTQNTASFPLDNINEVDKTKLTQSKVSSDSDYVYDQNCRMYFSQSTGYYYDETSGLMFDPRSRTYYKYNYDTGMYEEALSESFSNQQTESDAVPLVNQMTKAESSVSVGDITDKTDLISQTVISHKSEIMENSLEELAVSKDWLVQEGSNVTVADKVREVVNANSKDFIYDASTKLYIIPSTGQYFDAERNLLYDPSTTAYYFYNNEEGKYEYYCQAKPNEPVTKESSKNENVSEEEKLKQRKRYWKKKREQDFQGTQTKVIKGANESSDGESSGIEFSSPEDGEIFSSDDESDTLVSISKPPKSPSSPSQQGSKSDVPPAIRAIVISSQSVQIGSLILISADSDFIGRETSNSVILPDISVSKVHAEVKFSKSAWKYSIQDLGSQNGTFINGHRLSEPKETSDSFWLNHGCVLALGSCTLLIHMHPDLETCDDCEPGQVMAALALLNDKITKDKHTVLTKEEKEKQRREELRQIKKKYNLLGADYQRQLHSVPSKGYVDKALMRRQTVGSDNPYEKTEQASIDIPIPETNKGYQMLEKMGWKLGEKLGAKGDRPEKVSEGSC